MRRNSSSPLPRFTESCLDTPGTLRQWLLGRSCGARSLKLLYPLGERFRSGVSLGFGKTQFIHLLFEKARKGTEHLLAGFLLPSLRSGSWKR